MSIHHIAGRELHSLFVLPLAWIILAAVQLILAVIFFYRLYVFVQFQPHLAGLESPPGLTDLVVAPLLGTAGSIVLLIAPLLTMRLISEERRAGTLQLLLSSPISMAEIILGKYLGLLGFFLIMIAMITLMPLSLLLGGYLDIGQFLAGLLGLTLLVATFCAVGLFMSTLTAIPVVAGVSTFGVLLLLWIIHWASQAGSDKISTALSYLSISRHFEPLLRGIFNVEDVVYYIIMITTLVILSIWRLDADRLHD